MIEAYGADWYYSSRWPTPDHIVPWKTFYVFYGELEHLEAITRLTMVRSIGLGRALGAKKEMAITMAFKRLIREAHPEDV